MIVMQIPRETNKQDRPKDGRTDRRIDEYMKHPAETVGSN